ncbi:hypothetical protein F511_17717 [Dorcoceras hygrometricum]|uniref:Chromo domain-containing protein n=1 Tax=Dorcoceras hygrometricum TaxID=472368 RepID=A0A2Z7C0Z2_9LAMI|nr:hypothetical protein F511_17717 [Dorcoceras hygrometricum]
MIKHANVHRRDVAFQVGDMVYLKLRPHRQQSVCKRIYQKLSPRYYGPFEVLQRVGVVAYKLKLPPSSRIHPVFHASCLKKAVGKPDWIQTLPKGLEEELTMEFEPEKVVAERFKQIGSEHIPQILIHWKGRSTDEDTWEDVPAFTAQFPDFNLEDKVVPKDGSIVMNHTGPSPSQSTRPIITQVYSRRRKKGGERDG